MVIRQYASCLMRAKKWDPLERVISHFQVTYSSANRHITQEAGNANIHALTRNHGQGDDPQSPELADTTTVETDQPVSTTEMADTSTNGLLKKPSTFSRLGAQASQPTCEYGTDVRQKAPPVTSHLAGTCRVQVSRRSADDTKNLHKTCHFHDLHNPNSKVFTSVRRSCLGAIDGPTSHLLFPFG